MAAYVQRTQTCAVMNCDINENKPDEHSTSNLLYERLT